jgi:antitoxin MazE
MACAVRLARWRNGPRPWRAWWLKLWAASRASSLKSITAAARPLDLLRMWHIKLEAWILEQTGIDFVPAKTGLHVINSAIMYIRKSISTEGNIVNLKIAKWGNSLALRIPADYVRSIGIKEGDQVQANMTIDGGISIRAAKWDRGAFACELKKFREAMPMGESVIEQLRRGARY